MNLSQLRAAKDGDELQGHEVRGLQFRALKLRGSFYLYYRAKSGQRRRPKLGDFPTGRSIRAVTRATGIPTGPARG